MNDLTRITLLLFNISLNRQPGCDFIRPFPLFWIQKSILSRARGYWNYSRIQRRFSRFFREWRVCPTSILYPVIGTLKVSHWIICAPSHPCIEMFVVCAWAWEQPWVPPLLISLLILLLISSFGLKEYKNSNPFFEHFHGFVKIAISVEF